RRRPRAGGQASRDLPVRRAQYRPLQVEDHHQAAVRMTDSGSDTPATPAGVSDGSVAPVAELAALLRGRRTVVLSGAGISTEAGIPRYRGGGGTGPPPAAGTSDLSGG